ncbi:MAG: response regulator [Ruminococcaceae bacterium]|nr:response regulator [Oscillospiraceae bacterium]
MGVLASEQFGNKLRELRTEKGLSQRQLADMMVVSRGAIFNWETGKRLPDISMLARLARCLGVESYVLLDAMQGPEEPVNVIVVEDMPALLRGSVRMLEEELPEVEICGFGSGEDALRFAQSSRVALAFLDVELGGEMDGLTLAKRLTEIDPRTNIIYLTGHTEYMQEAAYEHFSGYILKPLTPERIRHELAHLRFPVRGLTP